jgi:hypothetical protein
MKGRINQSKNQEKKLAKRLLRGNRRCSEIRVVCVLCHCDVFDFSLDPCMHASIDGIGWKLFSRMIHSMKSEIIQED